MVFHPPQCAVSCRRHCSHEAFPSLQVFNDNEINKRHIFIEHIIPHDIGAK